MRKLGRFALFFVLIGLGVLIVGVFAKQPSHQRDWKTEYAVLPQAFFQGERLTIHDLRNFTYNPDGSVRVARYEDRTYDLSKLEGLWYGISHFFDYGLAHTFVSFGFQDGEYLTISVEARQAKGQSYHPLRGLLREYELIYLATDERDVIGVRTHVRGERVHLYEVKVETEKMRRLLFIMLGTMNEIYQTPTFYNTLVDNCTTNILQHAERLSVWDIYLDYRGLLPGYSDSLIYEIGALDTSVPLEELRRKSRIDPAVTAIDDPEFSRKIRGL
ncbi:MAG: DUF4105 domain-containing protein [Nitrospiraceae bacterium]